MVQAIDDASELEELEDALDDTATLLCEEALLCDATLLCDEALAAVEELAAGVSLEPPPPPPHANTIRLERRTAGKDRQRLVWPLES